MKLKRLRINDDVRQVQGGMDETVPSMGRRHRGEGVQPTLEPTSFERRNPAVAYTLLGARTRIGKAFVDIFLRTRVKTREACWVGVRVQARQIAPEFSPSLLSGE